MDEELIDRVYECAFVPELWPDVLGRLSTIASARSGWMFVAKESRHDPLDALIRADETRLIVAPAVNGAALAMIVAAPSWDRVEPRSPRDALMVQESGIKQSAAQGAPVDIDLDAWHDAVSRSATSAARSG